MKRLSLAALAAALSLGVSAPSALADANSAQTLEPIVIVAGGQSDCDVSYNDGYGSAYTKVATNPGDWNSPALAATDIHVWTSGAYDSHGSFVPVDERYTLCQEPLSSVVGLGEQLYRRLQTIADTSPSGKVDLIGGSVGGVIARWCLSQVSGCRDLVDDSIGMTVPHYGTTIANIFNCQVMNFAGTYQLCMDLVATEPALQTLNGIPTGNPNWDTKYRANAVDDSPGSVEYTNFWTWTDGVIQPSERARLVDGAHNLRVYRNGQQLTHASILNPSTCKGAAKWNDVTAVVEWATFFAMDAQQYPHPVPNTPGAANTESIGDCIYGPPGAV